MCLFPPRGKKRWNVEFATNRSVSSKAATRGGKEDRPGRFTKTNCRNRSDKPTAKSSRRIPVSNESCGWSLRGNTGANRKEPERRRNAVRRPIPRNRPKSARCIRKCQPDLRRYGEGDGIKSIPSPFSFHHPARWNAGARGRPISPHFHHVSFSMLIRRSFSVSSSSTCGGRGWQDFRSKPSFALNTCSFTSKMDMVRPSACSEMFV